MKQVILATIVWVGVSMLLISFLTRPYHVDSIRCLDKAGNVILEGSGEVEDVSSDAYIVYYQGLKMRISGATCIFKNSN